MQLTHAFLRRGALGAAVALAITLSSSNAALAEPHPSPPMPTATTSSGSPYVGALFPPGSSDHSCTATVLNSLTGDLVLTAAHCVSGTAIGWTFAPDWRNGAGPEVSWTVTAAYALPGWITSGDTQEDVAILKVAPQQIGGQHRTLQSVTGAANLGFAPRTGQRITDIAYNDGADAPVACTTRTYWTSGFPSFNCHGFVGGSSGSPWLVADGRRPRIVGVIGGLHQGGCVDYTSYSSSFGEQLVDLLVHAQFSRTGDTLPAAGSDGC